MNPLLFPLFAEQKRGGTRTFPLLRQQKGEASSEARRRGFIHRFLNCDRDDFSMINCDGWLVGAVREPPLHPAPPGGSAHPPPFASAKGGRDERSETQGVHTL